MKRATAPGLVTPLLKAARARGLATLDGLEMLIGQAALAFDIFFDAPPLLGSWKRLYALVLGELVLCILLFRLFSWAFS